ncbi:MAG: HNH endonuclease [Chloroflexi bacterium]|nr:HNH endonuclease [Chloroflexota bacterium]
MTETLRQIVRERAQFRCEYCRMPERLLPYHRFEIDHIRPEKFGGLTSAENLAWACLSCNRHKGPLVAGHNPDSSQLVRLFNPRGDTWEERFVYRPPHIIGRTAIGHATAWALEMNSSDRIELREALGQWFVPWS